MQVSIAVTILSLAASVYSGGVTIEKTNPKFLSPYPSIPGAKQCGGPGEFVQLRLSACIPPSTSACKVKAGSNLISEIDYIPVINMDSLEMESKAGIAGKEPQTKNLGAIPNSKVVKGEKYTIRDSGVTIPAEAVGKKFTGTYSVRNAADKSLRICVEAEVEVVA